MNVCSMLLSVVGVNVGVVRVGTPEFRPSRAINCNREKEENFLLVPAINSMPQKARERNIKIHKEMKRTLNAYVQFKSTIVFMLKTDL